MVELQSGLLSRILRALLWGLVIKQENAPWTINKCLFGFETRTLAQTRLKLSAAEDGLCLLLGVCLHTYPSALLRTEPKVLCKLGKHSTN